MGLTKDGQGIMQVFQGMPQEDHIERLAGISQGFQFA